MLGREKKSHENSRGTKRKKLKIPFHDHIVLKIMGSKSHQRKYGFTTSSSVSNQLNVVTTASNGITKKGKESTRPKK